MKVIDIGGIRVEFPYDAYSCQKAFMEKVVEALKKSENAALESPTGTGKTLCLLCAAIAFVKDAKTKITVDEVGNVGGVSAARLFPKILYASRTHSQLAQVVRELNKTVYKDTKAVTLASRDILCINDSVANESNNVTKSLLCRNLVKSRKCHFFNEFDKQDTPSLNMIYNDDGLVPDIEDIVKFGRRNKICPFFSTRKMFENAELILLPYNYIIDQRLQRIHNIDLRGNIVIFDEGHNLESICEESVSVSLSTSDISGCIHEAKNVLELLIKDDEEIRSRMVPSYL